MNEQMIEAQDVLDAPLPVVNPANGTPMPKPVIFAQTEEQFPEVTEEKPTIH
jgi:hypothetical protein